MAHEIATMIDGRAAMAYVGEQPWHGLGQVLTRNASIETWSQEAGMNFIIGGAPVMFEDNQGKMHAQGSKQVLYRQDTGAPLGVVGNKYKVVQPIEIMEFFRDLTKEQGFELETAGVLFGGAKYWALARTGNEVTIAGNDVLKDYLLLATACDGSLKTTARRTSIRVVCNNTLSLSNSKAKGDDIKISHASTFNAADVKSELGLGLDEWTTFSEQARQLSETPVTDAQAIEFVRNLFKDKSDKGNTQTSKVLQLFSGQGKGSDYKSSKGTAWGLLNATTEMLDWHYGGNQDNRLAGSWFYSGLTMKQQAMNDLLALAA
jgi:phage/plasmid-like protein (TIGR03299 family)